MNNEIFAKEIPSYIIYYRDGTIYNARECYIDRFWNKAKEDYLTKIKFPVEKI